MHLAWMHNRLLIKILKKYIKLNLYNKLIIYCLFVISKAKSEIVIYVIHVYLFNVMHEYVAANL